MRSKLKKILRASGYRVESTKYMLKQVADRHALIELDFDHVLAKYLFDRSSGKNFRFLQIGAFDGIECDPIRKYLLKFDWEGFMMEPQPVPFSRLGELYGNRERLVLLNAAVSRTDGTSPLHVLVGDELPVWAKGMVSFNKDNILKHHDLVPNISEHIKSIEIPTIKLETLFRKYKVDYLDLLQIDTEGYDAEILRMFPFDILKPSIIHFESKHIAKEDLERLLDSLIDLGYRFSTDKGEDIVCIQNAESL